jgi:hypothetical protein
MIYVLTYNNISNNAQIKNKYINCNNYNKINYNNMINNKIKLFITLILNMINKIPSNLIF